LGCGGAGLDRREATVEIGTRLFIVGVGGALVLGGLACATASPSQGGSAARSEDLPAWVDDACIGQPADTVCAVGESELVAASIEAGKTDAEVAAQNRLQAQIEVELGRLLERFNNAARDVSNGRFHGQQSLSDINRSFSEKTLRGAKLAKYFYFPNRAEPKRVFVLAIVNANTVKLSEDIMQSLLRAAERDRLFTNAAEAQLRYEAVRREYLAEKGAAAPSAAAPPTAGVAAPTGPAVEAPKAGK
jgi:hypothetical protein